MRAGLRLRVVVGAPLQFPGREAPDVHVVFVQTGVVAVVGELDLELHLAGAHGQSAHGTRRPDAGAAPRAVGPAAGKLAISNDGTGLLAEGVLVHLDDLDACTNPRNEKRGQARCQRVRRQTRLSEAQWKAFEVYHRSAERTRSARPPALSRAASSSPRRCRSARPGARRR